MEHDIELDYDQIALKEISNKGCFTHNHRTWIKALELMQEKKIQLHPLVSENYPLEQCEEALSRFEEESGLKLFN